ncbi:MAG: hypothetical protein SNF33_08170 [Candidatus Algichlamydia australiensis]|nr:hypothetical protein [Chlamydiales bacterium]
MQLGFKKGALIALVAFLGVNLPLQADWRQFHSVNGGCSVAFPSAPEHIRQTMNVPEEQVDLNYDVYVAAEGNKAVYMVLIAEYPSFVDESYAELSLESFINGIVGQHPSNQLVSADMVNVQGHKGVDFFVKTEDVFFMGRAVMAKNSLYLLAMECEANNYSEQSFKRFISSFKLQ